MPGLREKRKLQGIENKKTGEIQFTITLPKNWIECSNLKVNEDVTLTHTGTTIIIDLE